MIGTARRKAEKTHDISRLATIIGQRHIEMLGVQIFVAIQMNPAQEAKRLTAIQHQIAAFDPAWQKIRRHTFFECLARDMARHVCDAGPDQANYIRGRIFLNPFKNADVA